MNQDYSTFGREALSKMADDAFSDYYRLATVSTTAPSKKDIARLAAATQKYLEICEALESIDATRKADA